MKSIDPMTLEPVIARAHALRPSLSGYRTQAYFVDEPMEVSSNARHPFAQVHGLSRKPGQHRLLIYRPLWEACTLAEQALILLMAMARVFPDRGRFVLEGPSVALNREQKAYAATGISRAQIYEKFDAMSVDVEKRAA